MSVCVCVAWQKQATAKMLQHKENGDLYGEYCFGSTRKTKNGSNAKKQNEKWNEQKKIEINTTIDWINH